MLGSGRVGPQTYSQKLPKPLLGREAGPLDSIERAERSSKLWAVGCLRSAQSLHEQNEQRKEEGRKQ